MLRVTSSRAVRDSSLDAVGFVCVFHNKSQGDVVFDLRTLSARCGAALYTARAVDAPAKLDAGQIRAGYFAIVGSEDGRPAYLSAANDWRLSVQAVRSDGPAKDGAPSQEVGP